ncbi:hypothetical protein BOTBODRAFT_163318 [Botryobasidium botryosum FD-172 SS1]|uniref:PrpF protein n=1 Tax=Botryobasidium botryosum (strain FD-172 SS1) TaxID=930990 RepID=A0A067MHG7_BOTB1|nr:hypothetical protein BOTBODRAFT_163318 [Botryobasidium botryosum FD-172 SS1]
MQRALAASFYRGGTSKGLFFNAQELAAFRGPVRDHIILAAMGSPDPDGRQIDGMGGGISSLSKIAVVSRPGDIMPRSPEYEFPGVQWADDIEKAQRKEDGWDVVYRFAQVGVRDSVVDWGSTCGNLVAAAAQYAVDERLVHEQALAALKSSAPSPWGTVPLPLRILAANNGKVVRAIVQLQLQERDYYVSNSGDAAIAGVPGMSAPIKIDNPLDGDPLSTGRERDKIQVDGKEIECTVIDAGLPVIFIPYTALFSSPSSLVVPPADLDASAQTMALIESIRRAASNVTPKLAAVFSSAAPKVCIVAPRMGYQTTGGHAVDADDIDLVIRAVSVGNIHRTVPATTLSALAVGAAYPNSVIAEAISASPRRSRDSPGHADGNMVSVVVGQPAGTSAASAKLTTVSGEQRPTSINYLRTARRLFQGQVLVPHDVAQV